jgi:hypothetical protein
MTPLKRALIEKAGNDHGFEYVLSAQGVDVHLASARHPAKVSVSLHPLGYWVDLLQGPTTLRSELDRTFVQLRREGSAYVLSSDSELALWLRRASALAQSLPNQVAVDFETQVQQALAELPASQGLNTEVQRMVRQRVGQDRYRQAMLTYWGGACAVTGLSFQPVLRASHAKPWADCTTDAERLDVFNGFLLSANLDALFDKFLISFADDGLLLINKKINLEDRVFLQLNDENRLRWVSVAHLPYIRHHREIFLKN